MDFCLRRQRPNSHGRKNNDLGKLAIGWPIQARDGGCPKTLLSGCPQIADSIKGRFADFAAYKQMISERRPARRALMHPPPGGGFWATLNLAGNFCKLEQGIEFDALRREICMGCAVPRRVRCGIRRNRIRRKLESRKRKIC